MKSLMPGLRMVLLCAAMAGPVPVAAAAAGVQPGEVEVIAGGIGEVEQQELAAREKEFNLKLVFSLGQGNYLADVDVAVSDAKGVKLIERRAAGPFLLARLPAGEYGVTATRLGKTISRKVRITAGRLRTEHLRWPADPEHDLPVSRWLDRE